MALHVRLLLQMLFPDVAGQSPYAIDVYADDVAVGPEAADLEVRPGSLVVWFQPGTIALDAPLEERALHAFRGLHLAVVESKSDLAPLAECGVIAGFGVLHESFAWTHRVVRALDHVAQLVIVNQLSDAPASAQFGGMRGDDLPGYFVLGSESGLIEVDPTLRWPTEAMLLPVVNLSLGPRSILFPIDLGDPVQAATWYLSRACLVVAAAGNSGAISGVETMSAWAQPPWVMAVGGTDDEAGSVLLKRSSRGVPEAPESGPDVVAWGRSFVDTTRTGTSFAAPRISYCALLCAAAILYLRHASQLARGGPIEGIRLVGVAIVDRFRGETWHHGAPRVAVPVLPALPQCRESEPSVRAFAQMAAAGWDAHPRGGPDQIRRLLLLAARAVPDVPRHEQGAGFVSVALVRELLATLPTRQWLRVLELDNYAQDIDAGLLEAPLFDEERVRQIETLVASTMPLVMWDYPSGQFRARPEQATEESEVPHG